jgi:hypothetical protein
MRIGKLEIVMYKQLTACWSSQCVETRQPIPAPHCKLGGVFNEAGNRDLGHNLLPPWRWDARRMTPTCQLSGAFR